MPKYEKYNAAYKKMTDTAAADRSAWDRLIEENADLKKDMGALCRRFDLPKPAPKDAYRWMNTPQYQVFKAEFDALMKKHKIPTRFIPNLTTKALWGSYAGLAFGDLTPPPEPEPVKGHPTKKDWRPVWEWEKRNPEWSRKDIALMLGVNPTTVYRKLGELDKRYLDTG